MARVIDLNADVGEGVDGDIDLLAFVTSAKVACGFHVAHVKPHGALYHRASVDGVCGVAIVSAMHATGVGSRCLPLRLGTLFRDRGSRTQCRG